MDGHLPSWNGSEPKWMVTRSFSYIFKDRPLVVYARSVTVTYKNIVLKINLSRIVYWFTNFSWREWTRTNGLYYGNIFIASWFSFGKGYSKKSFFWWVWFLSTKVRFFGRVSFGRVLKRYQGWNLVRGDINVELTVSLDFSDSKNQPRSIVNSRGKKRKPGSRSLSYMLGTEDKDFLNFLNKCFE